MSEEVNNGITSFEWVQAVDIKGKTNPDNWRRHPAQQIKAFNELKALVGWAKPIIFNLQLDMIVDGHMRVEQAESDELLPVIFGNWTRDQQDMLLEWLDPIGGMAFTDLDKLANLDSRTAKIKGVADSTMLNRLTEAKMNGEQNIIPSVDAESEAQKSNGGADVENVPVSSHVVRISFDTEAEAEEMKVFLQDTYPALADRITSISTIY